MRKLLLAAILAAATSSQPAPAFHVFSYFIDNGEDGLHLLSSSDGLHWMFHLVWTTGWWDKGIGIAHSKNLVDWSEQSFLPVMADRPDALNCWAPEIFFDEETGRFLIFWATSPTREPDSAHRIYYVE